MKEDSKPKSDERLLLDEVVPHAKLDQLTQQLQLCAGLTPDEQLPVFHAVIETGRKIGHLYDRFQLRREQKQPSHSSGTTPTLTTQMKNTLHRYPTVKDTGLNFNYAFSWCMHTAAHIMSTHEDEQNPLRDAASALWERSRERFVTSNLPLVDFYSRPHIRALGEQHAADLIAAGIRGLTRATELFNYQRGFTFGTFAQWHIREQMQKYRRRIERTHSREDTFTALTRNDDDATPFEDALTANTTPDPEEAAIQRVEHSWLQQQFDLLDPQARTLLAGRFGIATEGPELSIQTLSIRCRIPEKVVESELAAIILHLREGGGEYQSPPHPLRTTAVLNRLRDATYEELGLFWFHKYLGFHISTARALVGLNDPKSQLAPYSQSLKNEDALPQEQFEEEVLKLLAQKKEDTHQAPQQVRATSSSRMDLSDTTIVESIMLTGTPILLTADYARSLIKGGHFVSSGTFAKELGIHRNTMYTWRGTTQFVTHVRHGHLSLIPKARADMIRAEVAVATQGMTPTELTNELGVSLLTLMRWTEKYEIPTVAPTYGARAAIYPPGSVEQLRKLVPPEPGEGELSLSEIRDRISYPVLRLAALQKHVAALVAEKGIETPVRRGRKSRIGSPHYPDWLVEELNKRYGGR